MYVYQKVNNAFYVGFFDPLGDWHNESTWKSARIASRRVAWLNGSGSGHFVGYEYSFENQEKKKNKGKVEEGDY